MEDPAICRFCLNWVNGQYISIDSVMIEKLQTICPDVKTTLLEKTIICPSCSDLLQKLDYLKKKYNKTKETCKVCGLNVVDQYHVTSNDTLQMCDDLGFSVPIESKVCDECTNIMYELNALKVALNNTLNESTVHCDESIIKDEVELGPVELIQSPSNLMEPNAGLEIDKTKTGTESSCDKKYYCNKNDLELLDRPSEHQVLGSPSLSIISLKDERELSDCSNSSSEDDIEHSSPSNNCSFEDDVKEQDDEMQRKMDTSENFEELCDRPSEFQVLGSPSNSSFEDDIEHSGPSNCSFGHDVEKQDDEMQRNMETSENFEDPNKMKTLESQESVSQVDEEEFHSSDQCSIESRNKGAVEAHSVVHQDPEEVSMFECHIYKYKTKQNENLKKHVLMHKKFKDVEIFDCHFCKYKTNRKGNLNKHLLIHKKPEEVEMFECHICKYKSKQKENLKKHVLIHKKPEDVEMFECHICGYKAKHKSHLTRHLLIHKNPEDVEMFDCHICAYRSKDKSHLKRHLLIHKKPEDVEIFECHICKHKTKHKSVFKKHVLIHKNPEDVEMFECHICKYKAIRKENLKQHLLIHKKPEDAKMFECHICKYTTKQKSDLKKHVLIHKKPENVEMFECHVCKYKAIHKSSLKTHLLIHKKPEDVEMFECHICGYKAKHKSHLKRHLLIHKKQNKTATSRNTF